MIKVLEEKCSSLNFTSKNVTGNCTHLAEKNSRPGAKITAILKLSRKYFNRF